MDRTLQKNHRITSYNVVAGKQIIAGADCYTDSKDENVFVLEVVPFEAELKDTGFTLNDEKQWDDFFDTDETEDTVLPEEILDQLLPTIFKEYPEKKQQVEIRKRKEVFDIVFTKNNRTLSLVMVYEYDRFVNSDPNFKPALFVHDTEEFDIWQFPLDAADEEIFGTIYPALKSPKSRK